MASDGSHILDITDEELKRILDPNDQISNITSNELIIENDKDYIDKAGITKEMYYQRREIYLKCKEDFGNDPYFDNIFGSYDYINSIQFMKISDVIQIINNTKQKEITEINLRNSLIGNIYKKMKQRIKDFKKLEEKNILVNIIDNGPRTRSTTET